MSRPGPAGQAGFTLIELMVSMVISGILVALILGSHARMTAAFRGQGKVSDVGKTLRAARAVMIDDIRMAGYKMPDGFKTAVWGDPTVIVPSISVNNQYAPGGPDELTLYYADADRAARVTAIDPANRQWADLVASGGFVAGDVVVMTNPRIVGGDSTTSAIAFYDACVVKVTAVNDASVPPRISFTTAGGSAPYNTATNAQCSDVASATTTEETAGDSETMVYKLVSRTYHIDANRPEIGLLQRSDDMEQGSFTDLALGVINLQLATRYAEATGTVDVDGDGDPKLDWYSADNQEVDNPGGEREAGGVPVELGLSLEVRTRQEVGGAAATASPELTDPTSATTVKFNSIGDWPSIDLITTPDASRPVAYRGDHVYRSSSLTIDLRNIGVGR